MTTAPSSPCVPSVTEGEKFLLDAAAGVSMVARSAGRDVRRGPFQSPTHRPDMTPDPDALPATPEAESSSSALPDRELRAVEAAVAGVAGLLIGRVLLGRAGGLAAGLVALGAGLLGKRPPPAANPPQPAGTSANGQAPPASREGTADMAETGSASPVEAVAMIGTTAAPETPDDAGAFAEMPALFEPIAPPASAAEVPPAERAPVNGLPVTTLLERAASELDSAAIPGPPLPSVTAAAAPAIMPVLEAFPADFAQLKEEQEPGPREEFLLIPAEAPKPLPPLEPVVEALGRSLALPEPTEPAQPIPGIALLAAELSPNPAMEAPEWSEMPPAAVLSGPSTEQQVAIPVNPGANPANTPVPQVNSPDNSAGMVAAGIPSLTSFIRPVAAPSAGGDAVAAPPVRPLAAPVRPIPLQPPNSLTESTPRSTSAPVRPIPLNEAGSAFSSPPPPPLPAPVPEIRTESIPDRTMPVSPPLSSESAGNELPAEAPPPPSTAVRPLAVPPLSAPATPVPDPDEIWRQAAAELACPRPEPSPSPSSIPSLATAAIFPVPVPAPAGPGSYPFPSLPGPPPTPDDAPAQVVPEAEALPPWLNQPSPTPPAVPPWLQESSAPAARSESRTFLPTIRLAVPSGPQPLAARTPHAQEAAAPPAPVALPGYRAEPLPPVPAAPPISILPSASAPTSASAPPLSAAPISASAATAAPLASSVNPGAVPPGKIHVERKEVQRLLGKVTPRRSILTPGLAGLLAVLAAILLGFAFKPQLQKFWEERVMGRGPAQAPPAAGPVIPAVNSDAPDVRVVPGNEASGVPESSPAAAPEPTPAPSAPVEEPAPPGPPQDSSPVNPDPPDTEPLPAPPPPGAPEDDSAAPLPVNETGARELVGRLLRATSAKQVLPHILDADRLGPSLEPYFRSGRAVPVATHQCELERSEKVPGSGWTMWMFKVTTENITAGFPVHVEAAEDGLRADWEMLSQCRDGALQKFIADPGAPPGVFYAGLQRRHVFPDMLPGKDHTRYLAFAIASPILNEIAHHAFIPHGSPLAARAEALFRFGSAPQAPVVELTHQDGHVEITGILREDWRVAEKR
jgi:hypothetical protein